jgi:hypothetical protein
VLPSLERRYDLICVKLQGRVDVNDVDVRVGEHLFIFGVTDVDSVRVADFVEFRLGALADGVHFGIRVTLVNRDEFGAEFEPDDTDTENTF